MHHGFTELSLLGQNYSKSQKLNLDNIYYLIYIIPYYILYIIYKKHTVSVQVFKYGNKVSNTKSTTHLKKEASDINISHEIFLKINRKFL